MIGYIYSKNKVTVNLDKPVTILDSDPRYSYVMRGLKERISKEDMQKIVDGQVNPKYVDNLVTSGVNIEVKNGEVYLDGEIVHNSIAERIKDFIREDLPFEHMLKFLENIQENPSYSSQQELLDFIEYKDLPITEDGYLLAYKSVTLDYKDWHTKSVDNSIGAKPKMKRSDVDDNRNQGCSKGFHAGSIEYVKGFNPYGHIMIVKIHPKDVVSVPHDCSCQKIRICEYEVIKEMEKVFDKPLCDTDGNELSGSNFVKASWEEIDSSYLDAEQQASWEEYEEESCEEDGRDEGYWYDAEDDYYNYDTDEDEDEDEDEDDYQLPPRLL